MGGDLRAVGDSFDTNNNVVRLDGYEVVTLRASMPLGERLEIFGRVENLLDEDYQTVSGYNTAGRGFFGGLRAKL